MSDLTKSVQNCGIHDTCENHNCFAISEKEAQRAIDVVKQACIDAIEKLGCEYWKDSVTPTVELKQAIEAIRDVK